MREFSKSLLGLAGGAAALALVAGAPSANALSIGPNYCLNDSATLCQMQLDLPEPGLTGYSGPYAGVDVTIKNGPGTNVLEFSVYSLTQQIGLTTYKYLFGDLALDLTGGAVSNPTFISGTFGLAKGGAGGHAAGGALSSSNVTFGAGIHEDGFGSPAPGNVFGNASVSTANGTVNGLTSLVFDLTWDRSFSDLRTLADQFMDLSEHGDHTVAGGASAAGHIYVTTVGDRDVLTANGVTGYAAWPNCQDQRDPSCPVVDPHNTVPEPATLALLGSALLGIGVLRRNRRREDA